MKCIKILTCFSHQIPYIVIGFVKRCITKFLDKQITGSREIDLWKFDSQKEIWNEFMIHYTKLIVDSNATFDHEYTYELEVNQSCINII